jgi:hypothetical protein
LVLFGTFLSLKPFLPMVVGAGLNPVGSPIFSSRQPAARQNKNALAQTCDLTTHALRGFFSRMHILKTLVGAALLFVAITCNAQDYQIERQPFGGGYNVYGPSRQLQQQIERQPFGGGFNVYGPGRQLQQQIERQPFGGGYNVHTMPLFNH